MRVHQKHVGNDAKLLIKFHWPNIITVTSIILRNIITTSNEVTNLVSYPLSNA